LNRRHEDFQLLSPRANRLKSLRNTEIFCDRYGQSGHFASLPAHAGWFMRRYPSFAHLQQNFNGFAVHPLPSEHYYSRAGGLAVLEIGVAPVPDLPGQTWIGSPIDRRTLPLYALRSGKKSANAARHFMPDRDDRPPDARCRHLAAPAIPACSAPSRTGSAYENGILTEATSGSEHRP